MLGFSQIQARIQRSLRGTLAAAFLLLSLSILVVSNALQLYSNLTAQQEVLATQQFAIAEKAARTVQDFIEGKLTTMKVAIRLNNPLEESSKNQELFLERLLGSDPSLRRLALFDIDQNRVAQNSRFSSLDYFEFSLEEIDQIFIFGKNKKTYISSIHIEASTNEPLITLAIPVQDIFGDSQGILVADVNLKFMWDLVAHLRIGENGLAYVVDETGNLIAFRDTGRVLKRENLAHLSEVKQFLENKTADTNVETAKGILDSRVVTSYFALGSPNWGVFVELPFGEAYSSVIKQLQVSLLIVLLAAVLAALVAIYLSRRITKPIVNLRDVALEVSKGKLDTKIQVLSTNEIGELAMAFNSMIKKLGLTYKSLKSEKEKLSDTNILMETLLTSMPVGVSLVQFPSGKIIYFNPMAKEILGRGIDPKARSGNYAQIFKFTKEDGSPYPESEMPVNESLREGGVITKRDMVVVRPDGTKHNLNVTAAPIKNNKGQITEVVVVFEDVTEEYIIDKAKTEFVSLASHQLRTPISSLNWYTEMLLSGDAGKLNDKQKDFLNEIYKSTRRMGELVGNLLNVSRIELGTFSISPKPFNLCDIIDNEVKQLKLEIENKELEFNQQCLVKPPILPLDNQLTSIIMQNLLTNAIKYTPVKGKISIIIDRDNQANVIVAVKDTGYGIPKADQDKIFTKMFRADNIRAKDTDGNGLGLYMVKSIVEQAGCKIWFESEENIGSTFYFSIPKPGMRKKVGAKRLGQALS